MEIKNLLKWAAILVVSGLVIVLFIIPLGGIGLSEAGNKFGGDDEIIKSTSQFEYRQYDGDWSGKFRTVVKKKGGITSLAVDADSATTGKYQRNVYYIPDEGDVGTYRAQTLWNNKVVEEGAITDIKKTATGWTFKVVPTTNGFETYQARVVDKDEFGY